MLTCPIQTCRPVTSNGLRYEALNDLLNGEFRRSPLDSRFRGIDTQKDLLESVDIIVCT